MCIIGSAALHKSSARNITGGQDRHPKRATCAPMGWEQWLVWRAVICRKKSSQLWEGKPDKPICFPSHQFFSTKIAISLQDRSKAVHDLVQCLCAFQGFWNASLPLRYCRLSDHTQQVYLIDSRNRMTKHHPQVQKELKSFPVAFPGKSHPMTQWLAG